MSDDKPRSKIELKRAWEAGKREYRVNIKRMGHIALVLALVVALMIVISNTRTGMLAQVASVLVFLGMLLLVIWLILFLKAIANRARLSDIAIPVGKRVIRLGDPPVFDKQLFSRLESLFGIYSSATQTLVETIAQLETLVQERQEKIGAAMAVLEDMRSEERSLRDSILALRETRPEAVVLFEEFLERKDRQARPRELLFLVIGIVGGGVIGVLLERIAIWLGM